MNKTYLIAGGTAIVSLAAGGAGGYFLARKRFNEQLDLAITAETDKVKKHFSILLMEARDGKPADPADIIFTKEDDEDLDFEPEEDPEEELSERDLEALKKGREKIADRAKAVQVDYRGISSKNTGEGEVAQNIFTADARQTKPEMPPRDPATGQFRTKETAPPTTQEGANEPYLIDEEAFLHNDGEYENKSFFYFAEDDTLLDIENNNEPVDSSLFGEAILSSFPLVEAGTEAAIYVRNDALQTDYQIRLRLEDLSEFIGLSNGDAYV